MISEAADPPDVPALDTAALQHRIDDLTRLVEGVAEANARAAELMAELEETRSALEARNEELVRQHEQLRRALSAAEAANSAREAQSRFLANMSHEMRTPLTAIIGLCDLLAGTDLDAEHHGYALTIQTSAGALMSLVNDLLDLAKIESGQFTLERIAFSPLEVVEAAVQIVASRIHAKGVDVAIDSEALPEAVIGDPGRISQILLNLLSNAAKFTERGEIVASVRVADRRGDTLVLRCAVRDTGIGIPLAMQDVVFRPFRQVDASTSRQFGGTGLGLSIARELATQMGGQMGMTSEPGAGSEFWFTVEVGSSPSAPTVAACLAGLQVWIVDPHAATRESIEAHLRALGATARTFATVPDAASGPDDAVVVLVDERLAATPAFTDGLGQRVGRARTVLLRSFLPPSGVSTPAAGGWLQKPVRRSALAEQLGAMGIDARPVPRRGTQVAAAAPFEYPRTPHILLVEDNAVNQAIAARILERLGAAVTVAENGQKALHLVAEHSFDVVLMDCQMPGMDGYEATRRIRAREQDTRLPIVALTAHAMREDRERCLEAGMDAYLTKPYYADTLRHTIQGLLNTSRV